MTGDADDGMLRMISPMGYCLAMHSRSEKLSLDISV